MSRRIRRLLSLRGAMALTTVAASVALGACDVPDPAGSGQIRYRDAVFATASLTDGVQYGESALPDGGRQKLLADLYQPAGDTASKRPAVIWMHGGGFAVGSRKDAMMTELSTRFAKRGYVAMSISYRLLAGSVCGGSASNTCVNAAIYASDDLRAAIRYLRANAASLRIDPDRIAIGGASAGAVTSLLVGASPNASGSNGNPGYSSAVRAVVSISGGIPLNASFTAGDPPVLFWHGTADTVVPYAWAKSNAEAMKTKGLIGVMHDVQGAGHVPWDQYSADMDRQSRNFLYGAMSLKSAPGSPGVPAN